MTQVSGATATVAVIVGWDLVLASVGDSTAYLDTGAEVVQVTLGSISCTSSFVDALIAAQSSVCLNWTLHSSVMVWLLRMFDCQSRVITSTKFVCVYQELQVTDNQRKAGVILVLLSMHAPACSSSQAFCNPLSHPQY